MPTQVVPGPVGDEAAIREAVCIHAQKIHDSCRAKDCVEDLRVFATTSTQPVVDTAVSVRPKNATLLYVSLDVSELAFNRGYYAVDLRYYYKITGEAYTLMNRSSEVLGLAVFDKRVILYGSESSAKSFCSVGEPVAGVAALPTAYVEAVDPVLLGMHIVESESSGEPDVYDVPEFISELLGDTLVFDADRQVYVTLGQFSIVRLERNTHLLMPAYDHCLPEKECVGGSEDDPCALFSRIDFPVEEFFPPDSLAAPEGYREALGR